MGKKVVALALGDVARRGGEVLDICRSNHAAYHGRLFEIRESGEFCLAELECPAFFQELLVLLDQAVHGKALRRTAVELDEVHGSEQEDDHTERGHQVRASEHRRRRTPLSLGGSVRDALEELAELRHRGVRFFAGRGASRCGCDGLSEFLRVRVEWVFASRLRRGRGAHTYR